MNERLQAEWLCVQKSYDKLDNMALCYKMICVLTWLYLQLINSPLYIMLSAIALFYLHECLLRTIQQRANQRLLQLENALTEKQDIGMQWHTSWQLNRGGVISLITSYLLQAAKPTVAITYVALLALSALKHVAF